jgi:hypothetical protein
MLTGELPFSGPTPQAMIAQHLNSRPRSIRTVRPEVTRKMEVAVLAALAKAPEDRPASGAAFISGLEEADGAE